MDPIAALGSPFYGPTMLFVRRVRIVLVLAVVACWVVAAASHADAQIPGTNGRIAFDSDRGGDFDVYTMAADGTDPRRLTTDPARDFSPAFSPDGTRIAFVSDRDGNDELYVMDADGTHQTRLTDDPGVEVGPVFSPDGTRIAFSSDRAGSQDVYTMAADGSDVRLVVGGASTQETGPAYAPDGRTIAFTSNAAEGDADVWTWPIVPRGSVVPYATRLTKSRAQDYRPSFSPDGKRIVFSSTRDLNGHSELYEMDADGGRQRRLTDNVWDDETPSFSPDGDVIVSGGDDVRVLSFLPARDTYLGRSWSTDENPSWQSVSRPPVCLDTVLHVTTDRPFSGPVACREPDAEPFTLSVIGAPPVHGTVATGPDGRVTYTPAPGHRGSDAFRVQARDRRGSTSPVAIVHVVVAPFALSGVRLRGTELRYRLSAAATVRLTLTRVATGRRLGPLALRGAAGWSFFTVRRRLAHRTLAPGRYRLTLTATLPGGPTVRRTLEATVRR